MQVSVTILVENTTPVPELIGEYGFSCLVTVDGRNLLFDTGSSGALFQNSQALGIKLEEIEEVVLSHGHYDHTGALLQLLQEYGPKKIYAHSRLLYPRLFPLKNGRIKKIGCPYSRSELIDAGAEFIMLDSYSPIWPGVYLSGEIPRSNDFEDVGGKFQVEVEGQAVVDDLPDDMALIIDHPRGLIIISGCAHAGMINIMSHAVQVTGQSKILAYIGGTHLLTASPARLDRTVAALRSLSVEKLMVAHCTGFYSAARLYCDLGDMIVKAETGMKFEF